MKKSERAFLYTILLALAGLNAMFLAGKLAPQAAIAKPQADPELGPASALTLTGDSGNTTLKSAGSRLSFGDEPFQRLYAVAFVDTGRIMNPLMNAQSLVDERTQLGEELTAKDKDYRDQLNALAAGLQGKTESDPEAAESREKGKKLLAEYQEWGKQAAKRRDDLEVTQLQKCYKDLLSAVDVVSSRRGIDIVYRAVPPEQDFRATNGDGALTEIRLRTALRAPKDLDITIDILEELNLPTEEIEPPQP